MLQGYVYFALLLWLSCVLGATSRDNKECEKSLHNTFSSTHRARLCPPDSGNVAPALCAASARSLRLSNDEIVDLCHGVDSIAPAECMKTLNNNRDRKTYGKKLCDNSTASILPAKCFNTLTTHPFKNHHALKPDAVTSFCTDIEDEGAISCLLAIADVNTPTLWNVAMGLLPEHCKESNLYIEQSATSRNNATYVPLKQPERRTLAKKMVESLFKTFVKKDESPEFTNMQNKRLSILACLEELKHISSNSNSPSQTTFQPAAVLKFCLHSNSRNMAPYSTEISLIKGITLERLVLKVEEKEEPEPTEQDYKEMAEEFGEEVDMIKQKWKETHDEDSNSKHKKRVEEPEYYRNYMAECLVRAGQITKKGSSTKVFLNTTQRLDLCDAVDNRNGPVNCVKKVLSDSKGDANKLLPDLLVTLCNGAGGMDQAMSQWLRRESRLEEARRRRSMSKDDAIRADAEKERRVRFIGSIQKLGLGPAECFLESGAIGLAHATVEQRVELCVGADGVGPAQCYNRARSIRQIDHSNKLHLCVGASGEYPAQCAIATPNYLDIEEKVTLCAGVRDSNVEEPVKCLQVIEGPTKALRNAPVKSIGVLSALVRDDAGRIARDMLIHLCSIRGSSHPLAAAACIKSAPQTLDHDDVIRTCTNATSADVLSRVQLCSKLLPRDWNYNEAMRLCGTNANNEEVENSGNNHKPIFRTEKDLINKLVHNTVACAEQMTSHRIYKQSSTSSGSTSYTMGHWTREEIIDLCSIEDESGNALMCAQTAKGSSSASMAYNAQFINPQTIVSVCRGSKENTLQDDQNPEINRELFKGSSREFVLAKNRFKEKVSGHMRDAGSCLTHLASMNIKKIIFAPLVPAMICTSEDPMYVVSCLTYGSAMSKAQIEKTDVEACYTEPRRINKASVVRLQSMDGAPQVTAGVRFNMLLSLSDQYDVLFSTSRDQDGSCSSQYAASTTSSDSSSSSATRVQVAINEDNEQGAVLWGIRSNKTDCGQLFFASLTISQPGIVKVTLSESMSRATTEGGGQYKDESQTLLVFSIDVQPNPVFGKTSMKCNFVFHSVISPTNYYKTKNGEIEESIITTKTSNILLLYASNVYRLLACGDTLEKWHVVWMDHQYGFHVDYKEGIASIWSGKDLPKLEDTFERRLGLENGIVDATLHDDTMKVKVKERHLTKMLRKAYYGKSLLWHPDRWVGMSIYEDIVQETFNAVVAAYEGLQVYINAEITILKEKLEERRKAAMENRIPGELHPANSRVDNHDEKNTAVSNGTSFEEVSSILESGELKDGDFLDEEMEDLIIREETADIIKKLTPMDTSATETEDIVSVTPEQLAGIEDPVYQ